MLFPYTFREGAIAEPHLVTIGYSHYCEVARWALEVGGIEFREAMYAPGYHLRIVGRLRSDRSRRSQSSYVGIESGVHGGRRKFSVPLLCMPDGRVLRDSWEILEHAIGAPEPEWKERMDQELGVAVRQIAYHYVLSKEGAHLIPAMLASASVIERTLWTLFSRPITKEMRKLMAITEANVRASKNQVLEILESAGGSLRAHEGALQAGGGFGPTELAFSGLAAVCVLPEEYGGSAVDMPPLASFPSTYRDFVEECRGTDAGRWVLESYRQRRGSSSF